MVPVPPLAAKVIVRLHFAVIVVCALIVTIVPGDWMKELPPTIHPENVRLGGGVNPHSGRV